MLGHLASDSRSQKNVKLQRARWFQSITIELYRREFELGALARKLFSTHPPPVSRQPMGFPTKTRCQHPRKRRERAQALRRSRQLHLAQRCETALAGSGLVDIAVRPLHRSATFDPSSELAKLQQQFRTA